MVTKVVNGISRLVGDWYDKFPKTSSLIVDGH